MYAHGDTETRSYFCILHIMRYPYHLIHRSNFLLLFKITHIVSGRYCYYWGQLFFFCVYNYFVKFIHIIK